MDQNQYWIRLPLQGANNVRELGGLPVADGAQTAWHRFLRADQLQELTETDREILYTYGVRTVIDLRSGQEVAKHPDSPELLARVDYHHIPFIREDLSPEGQASMEESLGKMKSLSSLYLILLERKEVIKTLFETIEQAPEGIVLFHCTAGKDRTGVLAMLLLMLAGADRQDCLTNYMQTYINLSRNERFRNLYETGYEHLIGSEPEFLIPAYDTVAAYPGGICGFLKDCGISDTCLESVKARILER